MVRTMFLFLVLSLATLDSSPILLRASHVAVDATGDLVINQTLSDGLQGVRENHRGTGCLERHSAIGQRQNLPRGDRSGQQAISEWGSGGDLRPERLLHIEPGAMGTGEQGLYQSERGADIVGYCSRRGCPIGGLDKYFGNRIGSGRRRLARTMATSRSRLPTTSSRVSFASWKPAGIQDNCLQDRIR